jgi:predicted nucleic acid-binding protein
MPRTIILDSFPLSSVGKNSAVPPTLTDQCRQWVRDCLIAGNPILVSGIIYYEVLRELERLGATAQITRLKAFCFSSPSRFLSVTTEHFEEAAKLWATARNQGSATASKEALDGDIILCAQVLGLGIAPQDYVVATTNTKHLAPFVSCELWSNIPPGS